ncbi:hypothetical protein BOP93_01035 [Pseudomonas orientalis]|uniref:Uncharacterized protein n=1 Tax=Pseudomonas orientalis TaxID=76758 RepID=A0A2L0RQH1_9PSED|nr:hypothetical protein BOP93_01035 [Pseudomonas orientalis]
MELPVLCDFPVPEALRCVIETELFTDELFVSPVERLVVKACTGFQGACSAQYLYTQKAD